MIHLSLSDMQRLTYHQKHGSMFEPEECTKITSHLDFCTMCKSRYYVKEGKVFDKTEDLSEQLTQLIIDINQDTIITVGNEKDGVEKINDITYLDNIMHKKFPDKVQKINNIFVLLHQYGFSKEKIQNVITKNLKELNNE